MNNTHASLGVKVENHMIEGPTQAVIVKANGCKSCLAKAISQTLLVDPEFKDLINKAVRMANEQRAREGN